MTLDGLRRDLTERATRAARGTATEWERILRRTSPSDTGYLAQQTTVTARQSSPTTISIDAKVDAPYASILRTGQRPHPITPRNPNGVLAFDVDGQTVFTRRVNHPGTQPDSWWDDAIRNLPDLIQREWRSG